MSSRSSPFPAGSHGPQDNGLLAKLPSADLDLLVPHLRPAELPLRTVLQEANRTARTAHFFTSGVCSVLSFMSEDDPMEIGLMGREGMFGIHSALGVDNAPHKSFMQVQGTSLAISVEDLRHVMRDSLPLTELLHRYASTTIVQTGQLGACNGRHALPERLARWLLMTQDRIEGDRVPITHEFLGLMLGVRRSGVTVGLGKLEKAGIVQQQRGGITVLNRKRLEASACACYGLTQMYYRRSFNHDERAAPEVGSGPGGNAQVKRDIGVLGLLD